MTVQLRTKVHFKLHYFRRQKRQRLFGNNSSEFYETSQNFILRENFVKLKKKSVSLSSSEAILILTSSFFAFY